MICCSFGENVTSCAADLVRQRETIAPSKVFRIEQTERLHMTAKFPECEKVTIGAWWQSLKSSQRSCLDFESHMQT
jgi:hypothetical protein